MLLRPSPEARQLIRAGDRERKAVLEGHRGNPKRWRAEAGARNRRHGSGREVNLNGGALVLAPLLLSQVETPGN